MLISLLATSLLLADSSSDLRRVQAALKIGDHKMAMEQAHHMLASDPQSAESYEALILALAHSTDHGRILQVWEEFAQQFPQQAHERRILEAMCWGILRSGKEATTLSTRLLATIGAAFTQDAYALEFLVAGMRDSHATIRSVSVQLASLLGDRPLKNEILALLQREKKNDVRLAVIKAIAKLRLVEARADLLVLIEGRYTSAEERACATAAVLEMSDHIDREQLKALSTHPRAALRQLAVEIIAKFELRDEAPVLCALIRDAHPDVVAAALRTIGLLRMSTIGTQPVVEALKPMAQMSEPMIGVTASWVVLLHDHRLGQEAFSRWIFHEQAEVRALAAAAISAAGPHGVDAALQFLDLTTDPYVQMNLARVLVGQRVHCERACEIIDRLLREHPERWMQAEGPFTPLIRSQLTHRPGILNYPEVVNQTLRLEMLNVLAILEHPSAGEAMRIFLKTCPYGVTGLAAEVLLGEGDEMAIDHVRELLKDPDKQIRAEAALVLATWGRDSSALPILLDVYPTADRMLKIKILEALARVSTQETIPFLIERLHEPSMNIRLIAAAVLLQTLNH